MKRRKADPTAWRDSPQGRLKYETAKADAQSRANLTGADHGIEFNDLFKEVRVWRLPAKQYRTGHELRCEVVYCETTMRACICCFHKLPPRQLGGICPRCSAAKSNPRREDAVNDPCGMLADGDPGEP